VDFRGLSVCYAIELQKRYTVLKNSVAIYLGSIHKFTGLLVKITFNSSKVRYSRTSSTRTPGGTSKVVLV